MNKGSQCFDFEGSFFSPNCDLRNCYIEKKANLKMSNDELLCDQIYNLTQEFGRIQFVREIMNLQKENKKLKSVLDEVKEYVTNDLKNFERLINTSPTPSFYQLPYGVCVSILNKIEKDGSNEKEEQKQQQVTIFDCEVS